MTGAVVPGGNPEALAARLAEFLENEQLNLRAGLAARRFAEQNLTAEASASRAMALYDRALG
jgi:glycosyltransferase involved in cell wall biosynthesis